jgi:hypothetical protein
MEAVEQKMARALQAQNTGQTDEAVQLYREVADETGILNFRFIAAREIAITFARLHAGNPNSNFLTRGTPENIELLKYAKIAIDSFPHINPELQQRMPIDDLIDLRATFVDQPGSLNKDMMNRVAVELVSLAKRYGREKIMIPASPEEAMTFIRQFNYQKQGEYSFDDLGVLAEIERLATAHRDVWVLPNRQSLKNELYVPSEGATTRETRSSKSGLWIGLGCLSLLVLPVVWLVIYLVACFVFAAMRFSPAEYFGPIFVISTLATIGLYASVLILFFVWRSRNSLLSFLKS